MQSAEDFIEAFCEADTCEKEFLVVQEFQSAIAAEVRVKAFERRFPPMCTGESSVELVALINSDAYALGAAEARGKAIDECHTEIFKHFTSLAAGQEFKFSDVRAAIYALKETP